MKNKFVKRVVVVVVVAARNIFHNNIFIFSRSFVKKKKNINNVPIYVCEI